MTELFQLETALQNARLEKTGPQARNVRHHDVEISVEFDNILKYAADDELSRVADGYGGSRITVNSGW